METGKLFFLTSSPGGTISSSCVRSREGGGRGERRKEEKAIDHCTDIYTAGNRYDAPIFGTWLFLCRRCDTSAAISTRGVDVEDGHGGKGGMVDPVEVSHVRTLNPNYALSFRPYMLISHRIRIYHSSHRKDLFMMIYFYLFNCCENTPYFSPGHCASSTYATFVTRTPSDSFHFRSISVPFPFHSIPFHSIPFPTPPPTLPIHPDPRDAQTHKEREKEREREIHTKRERKREIYTHTHRSTHTQIFRSSLSHTHTHTHRHTHTHVFFGVYS